MARERVSLEPSAVKSTLWEAASLLERLGLRYAIVGGLAVGAWGVNRSTDDVDIFAELPVRRRAEIRKALQDLGFKVPAMAEELAKFGVFRSRSKSGVFLDLFDAVGPLGEALLERRRQVRLDKRKLWFVAPEELAALKAFSERERDFEDVAALVAVLGRKLDLRRVRAWAKKLDSSIGGDDVTERLERAITTSRRRRQKKR
ncbi:MAG TPA: nucleotidyltransferase [Polyangiaceae bacterium]